MAEPLPLGPCTECECAAFERRKRDVLRSGDEKKQCGKCGHSKADHRIVSLAPRDVRAATGSAAASVQVPPARGINAAAPVPAPASPRADVTRAPRQDAQVTSVPASTTLRRAAPSSPSPSSSTTALSAGPATFSVPGASQVLPAPAKRDTQSPPVTETQSRIDAVKSFTQALFMGGIALIVLLYVNDYHSWAAVFAVLFFMVGALAAIVMVYAVMLDVLAGLLVQALLMPFLVLLGLANSVRPWLATTSGGGGINKKKNAPVH